MDDANDLSFSQLLDVLAEKLARKLSEEPSRLFPSRLMTVDQAAVYIGQTSEAVQDLVSSGKIPTMRTDCRAFIDRLDLDSFIEERKTRLPDPTGWQ